MIGCQLATANPLDMKRMTSAITIGGHEVRHVVAVEVDKSVDMLQDVATITLPATLYGKTLNIDDKVKRGDVVDIDVGYDGENRNEFKGFVSTLSNDANIVIKCEDAMFLWRKAVKSKEYKSVAVVAILKDLAAQIGGFEVVAAKGAEAVKFDKFTVADADGVEVLQKIKEQTKMNIYVRDKELHVALPYYEQMGKVGYDFAKNVESASLKWLRADERKVQVKVIGIAKDNKRTTVTVGESGGDTITLNRYKVTDKSALRAIGEAEIEQYRIDGYEGSITGWLQPYCTYGYFATIRDKDYPSREGEYYIKAVKVTFDDGGGKRQVTLGKRIS